MAERNSSKQSLITTLAELLIPPLLLLGLYIFVIAIATGLLTSPFWPLATRWLCIILIALALLSLSIGAGQEDSKQPSIKKVRYSSEYLRRRQERDNQEPSG